MQKVSILPLCSIYEIYFWLVGTGKKTFPLVAKEKKTKKFLKINTPTTPPAAYKSFFSMSKGK